jgi:hypothetical protein
VPEIMATLIYLLPTAASINKTLKHKITINIRISESSKILLADMDYK